MRNAFLFPGIALLQHVAAHGRITNVTTSSGTVYPGWDPEYAQSAQPLPLLASWSASNLGNNYISPSAFNSTNIACHFNSKPGALHVNATAGEKLTMQWNEWPTSHKGPVLDYLARCDGGDCSTADKEKLEWVKIGQLGWLNSSGWVELGGTWTSDVLIANKFQWTVKIPKALEPGSYVLRHEIIALHVAEKKYGAQAYPQCVNLRVSGGSTLAGEQTKRLDGGNVGRELYKVEDKGILVDIHRKIDGYDIPGPKLWNGSDVITQPNQ
ncbi:lytic polysaccharide monooxygenase [Aaosphaeria arxii CBS 175.79]|uniref:Lytic polysaccharide monooxygenase n=1 Tax=Aaosphaeria arxii CBS 175.79 TaxID=1450172 RepID=A0A6A5Y4M2_9PLEO|nr:lytic polysaccharide monooxygenase [Aaosphaeria arxii CBS 175.79]KAF2020502.1 lytic polysaccharide monooxygenase [Aaosphaeria arxii CBS 175.79]